MRDPASYNRLFNQLAEAGVRISNGKVVPGTGDATALSAEAREIYERLLPPAAAPVGAVRETDRQIAAQLLIESGLTPAAAWQRVAVNPETEIESLRPQLEQKRATLQNIADARAKAAFEASPEGKKLRAAELADEEAQLDHEAKLATRYIRHNELVSDDVLEQMSPSERVRLAFSPGRDESPIAAAIDRRKSKYTRPVTDPDDIETNLERAGFTREED